jgi:hypothetical protein
MIQFQFAQESTRPEVAEQMLEHVKTTFEGIAWAALVDGAFDYGKAALALKTTPLNCYLSPDLQALGEAAPCLFPLPGDDTLPEQVGKLLAHCNGRPMLSFLATTRPLEEIVKQWQPLHWAYTTDGQKQILRFADTRILASLPSILTSAQWAAWHQPLVAWHYIDRMGQLAQLPNIPLSASEPTVQTPSKIEISDEQLARMLDCSEADTVLDFLQARYPESVPNEISGGQFYQLANRALERARQYKFDAWEDKVVFVSTTISSMGCFLEDVKLHQTLSALAQNPELTTDDFLIAQLDPWFQEWLSNGMKSCLKP